MKLSCFLDVSDIAALDRLAQRWGAGRSTLVRRAVREWLEQQAGPAAQGGAS